MKKLLLAILCFPLIGFGQSDLKNSKELIAEYSYSEYGDLPHIIFTDENSEEWDFGYGENDFGEFDFGQMEHFETNEKLVGKKFKIYWMNKKVETYAEDGETVIETEAPSVIKIELIK